jgi:hypothetical protein
MGAVAVSERIHDTIMGAAAEGTIGSSTATYSGHFASCAAGTATLDIYKNEDLFERGRQLSPYFRRDSRCATFRRRGHSRLRNVRDHRRTLTAGRGSAGRLSRRNCSRMDQPQDHRRLGDRRAAAHREKHVDEIADILRRTLKRFDAGGFGARRWRPDPDVAICFTQQGFP